LTKLGVEGDSQAMRLALRIVCLEEKEKGEKARISGNGNEKGKKKKGEEDAANNGGGGGSGTGTSAAFHTSAFVQTMDNHFDDVKDLAVKQGILSVARALGKYKEEEKRHFPMTSFLYSHPHAYLYTYI
jgi:hypothetical protein